MFGSDQEVAGLMKAVKRCNATGEFYWIGSDGWSARTLVTKGQLYCESMFLLITNIFFETVVLRKAQIHDFKKLCDTYFRVKVAQSSVLPDFDKL